MILRFLKDFMRFYGAYNILMDLMGFKVMYLNLKGFKGIKDLKEIRYFS